MRRFLYFLPTPGANPQMLAARGLLDRFTVGGRLIEHSVTPATECMGSGCIVAAGTNPPTTAQRWVEGEKFHVGVEDLAPRPEDLERPVGIDGYGVLLADGNIWRVPLVHKWDAAELRHVPGVPSAMTLIGGRVQYQIRAEYQVVDAIASRLFAAFIEEKTVPMAQLMQDAAALLAVNYRLGVEECGLLGLFDSTNILEVIQAAIDIKALQEQARGLSMEGLVFAEPVIQDE